MHLCMFCTTAHALMVSDCGSLDTGTRPKRNTVPGDSRSSCASMKKKGVEPSESLGSSAPLNVTGPASCVTGPTSSGSSSSSSVLRIDSGSGGRCPASVLTIFTDFFVSALNGSASGMATSISTSSFSIAPSSSSSNAPTSPVGKSSSSSSISNRTDFFALLPGVLAGERAIVAAVDAATALRGERRGATGGTYGFVFGLGADTTIGAVDPTSMSTPARISSNIASVSASAAKSSNFFFFGTPPTSIPALLFAFAFAFFAFSFALSFFFGSGAAFCAFLPSASYSSSSE